MECLLLHTGLLFHFPKILLPLRAFLLVFVSLIQRGVSLVFVEKATLPLSTSVSLAVSLYFHLFSISLHSHSPSSPLSFIDIRCKF